MQTFQVSPLLKFLGEHFFTWSMPFVMICLNIIAHREIFELNVLVAFTAGLAINYLWKFSFWVVNQFESAS